MKRSLLIVFFILPLVALSIGFILKPYYTSAIRQDGLTVRNNKDDTIRIAYIGDSWAAYHKNMDCIIDSLVSRGTNKPVIVRIEGISGITSKNIYYSLFRDSLMRSAIEWGPDFCFVVAGINDSDRKMGKNYYKKNMRLIIELLLEYHIVPIILEIPSYDIYYSYKRRNRKVKLQYLVSMLLTWSKMDCIQDYREAYKELIEECGWQKATINILSEDWNPDGYKDKRALYDEGLMHLNYKGYNILDSCISRKIIEHVNGMISKETY